jgi:hypothetical protein
MAQFDVYRFAPRGAGFAYVIDLQSDLLDGLATRVVAPLYALKGSHTRSYSPVVALSVHTT